ncbi:MAG: LON peptidase substrate-binding domain-containing protein [Alphaproteobacteria bacterium]|jgi:Lon protease-like protein
MTRHPFDPDADALPDELALFPLTGALLLPRGRLPLNIFEPRYLAMTRHALAHGRMIGLVQPMADGQPGLSAPDATPLYPAGCAGRIVSFQETDDGRYLITLRGICRFEIGEELAMVDGFRRARVAFDTYLGDLEEARDGQIDRDRLLAGLRGYFEIQNIDADWESIERTPDERLVTTIAMVCPFEADEKQALLESPDLAGRAKLLIGLVETALRDDDGQMSTTVN